MPPRKIRIPPEVRDLIRGLHPALKRKTRSALDLILTNPTVGKVLHAELEGLWSLRMGRFRIIYRWDESIIEIVAFGPRRFIYEETLRLVRRPEPPKQKE